MKYEEESNKQRFPNAFVFLAGFGEKNIPRGETINHITWTRDYAFGAFSKQYDLADFSKEFISL